MADDKKEYGDITSVHPLYSVHLPDWIEMRDCVMGSRAVKAAGTVYLPKPDGFNAQDDTGVAMYEAYKTRAQFPEILSPAILGMLGVMMRTEPKIDGLPSGMEYLWESATADGMTLENLYRKIGEELLTTGRVGVLTDAPTADVGGGNPYLALYTSESITNWSKERDFFTLRELVRERDGFTWRETVRYRVLTLENGVYRTGIFGDLANTMDDGTVVDVLARGEVAIDEIPFVIGGSRDMSVDPDQIPLISIARGALAMYRLDADYRHQLFMSGQETLVFAGLDPDDVPQYVGAGVAVALPVGGTAVYASPKGTGISAHRLAITDELERTAAAGARVMDTTARGAESGDALRMRARASTASLLTVALSTAAIMERALRNTAKMMGENPDEIIVKPNLDFLDNPLSPTDAVALLQLWTARAISYSTYYENLRRAEITDNERSPEDEQKLINDENYLPEIDAVEAPVNIPGVSTPKSPL